MALSLTNIAAINIPTTYMPSSTSTSTLTLTLTPQPLKTLLFCHNES